jgi:hypothetical protein
MGFPIPAAPRLSSRDQVLGGSLSVQAILVYGNTIKVRAIFGGSLASRLTQHHLDHGYQASAYPWSHWQLKETRSLQFLWARSDTFAEATGEEITINMHRGGVNSTTRVDCRQSLCRLKGVQVAMKPHLLHSLYSAFPLTLWLNSSPLG